MTRNGKMKKLALAALAVSGLSVGSLAAMTAPASARVVCDWDGDDCYRTYPRYWDRDWDWERHERHEWEERRERDEAYRRWYWSHYRYDRPYSGGQVWFNF